MAFSLNFRTILSGANTNTLDKTVAVTADGLDSREIAVPVGSDKQVNCVFQLADLKGYEFVSDGTVLMQTNSPVGTGTAGDDITLLAGQPIVWYNGCQYAKHFSTDVSTLYFTNSSGAVVNVSIRILKDTSVSF